MFNGTVGNALLKEAALNAIWLHRSLFDFDEDVRTNPKLRELLEQKDAEERASKEENQLFVG